MGSRRSPAPTRWCRPSRGALARADPGPRAVLVIRGPDGARAQRDADRVGADGDRAADDPVGVRVDLGDGVVLRVGDPDRAGAGGDLARVAPDLDRVAG